MWWFMKNNITRQDRYSEVLNRLGNSNSMLGMGAQWEDDSDKCGCEWPGPGSLVSPSLVPVITSCVGRLGAVLPATLLILHHSLYLSPVKHQHYTPKGQDAVGNM